MKKTTARSIVLMILLFILNGCSNATVSTDSPSAQANSNTTPEKNVTTEDTSEAISSTQASDNPNTQTEEVFVKNETINQFIINYNLISESPFKDISSSRNYNCYAHSYGFYFEMRDSSNEFKVIVNQTNETADSGVSGMLQPFIDIVRVLNPSLSESDASLFFEEKTSGYMTEDTLGDLTIKFFPDTSNSRGHLEVIKGN